MCYIINSGVKTVKRKILLIDNKNDSSERIIKILQADYTVISAETAEAVFELSVGEIGCISAIVIQVADNSDGMSILKKLGEKISLKAVPVVAVVSENDRIKEQTVQLGAVSLVTESTIQSMLPSVIQNVVRVREMANYDEYMLRDWLTGLYTKNYFCIEAAGRIISKAPGYYVLSYLNICYFKMINSQYGMEKGDTILQYIADRIAECMSHVEGIVCHAIADHFVLLYPVKYQDSRIMTDTKRMIMNPPCIDRSIQITVGRYPVENLTLSVPSMIERAVIAEESLKNNSGKNVAVYDQSMETQIPENIDDVEAVLQQALQEHQFEVWFQPKINYTNGALIGAEALIRWRHPKRGLLYPDSFLPMFEKSGLIYQIDQYVFEQVCLYIRERKLAGQALVPISVNISRYDLYHDNLAENLKELTQKYEVPVMALHLEITEAAFSESNKQTINAVEKLQKMGFVVEIDDFGNGYSSLNLLSRLSVDVLKIDMRFLDEKKIKSKGGSLIEAIVRMARWNGVTVVAEGVETVNQADFLNSIGCSYIQGYLYSKPLSKNEYELAIVNHSFEETIEAIKAVGNYDNEAFWNADSLDTMVFNHFSGGAFIFEYCNDECEMLRINSEFKKTFHSTLTEQEILKIKPLSKVSKKDRHVAVNMVKRALESGTAEMCELYSKTYSAPGKGEYVYFYVKKIASHKDRSLLYGYVENITAQRLAEKKEQLARKEQQAATEQLNAIMNNVNGGFSATIMENGAPKILFANDRFYQMLGYSREQFEKEVSNAHDLTVSEDKETVVRKTEEASKCGKAFELSYRIRRRDGEIRWWQSNVSIVKLPDITAPVQIGIANDVTEQFPITEKEKSTNAQIRFLCEVAQDLLAQPDAEQGICEMLKKIMEYYGGERAFIFECDLQKNTGDYTYEICADGVKTGKDKMPFLWSEHTGRNSISYININHMDVDAPERKTLQNYGIQTIITVPLYRGEELLGFFCISNMKKNNDAVERIVTLCNYMVIMLTRRDWNIRLSNDRNIISEAEQALSAADKQRRHLLEKMPGGVGMYNFYSDNRLENIYTNDGFYSMLGTVREERNEFGGFRTLDAIHKTEKKRVIVSLRKAFDHNETADIDLRILVRDKEYRWVNAKVNVISGTEQKLTVCAFFSDIDRLKQHELRMAKDQDAIVEAGKDNGLSFWFYDLDRREPLLQFTKQAEEESEAEVEKFKDQFSIERRIYPGDEAVFQTTMEQMLSGAESSTCTVRVLDYGMTNYKWQRIIYTRMKDSGEGTRIAIVIAINADAEQENKLRYEQEQNFRREIFKNAVAYYKLNLTKNKIEEHYSKYKDFPEVADSNKENSLNSQMKKLIAEDDYERISKVLFYDGLFRAYQRGESALSVVFRRKVKGVGLRWTSARAVLTKDPGTAEPIAFVYFLNIDVEKKDQMARDCLMDEETEHLMLVNSRTGMAHLVSIEGQEPIEEQEDFVYKESVSEYMESITDSENRDELENLYSVESIKLRLEQNPVFNITFQKKEKDNSIHRKQARILFLDRTHEDILFIQRDITDLYEEEQRQKKLLQSAAEAALQSSHAKSNFIMHVSHDMRTPLNAIMSFSGKEMLSDATKEQMEQYFEQIHTSGDYLLGIINNVLDMSKIEQSKLVLQMEQYPLNEFVKTINTIIEPMCGKKNIEFILDQGTKPLECVITDRTRFNQIFINLLTNAVNYTESGGRVELIMRPGCFKIKDNGIGMSPEFLPRAFDSFTQEHREEKRGKQQGVGLGLPIVKEIVTLMGGKISVESQLGVGTVFTVEMTLKTVDQTIDKKHPAKEPELQGLRVLLCEDNEINTEIAATLLRKQGCLIECAENGKVGLDKFMNSEENYYDIILMDISMPVMDGFESTMQIRSLKRKDADIPIVALTANAFTEDAKTTKDAGMNAHLTKPFRPSMMFETISRLVSDRKQKRRE